MKALHPQNTFSGYSLHHTKRQCCKQTLTTAFTRSLGMVLAYSIHPNPNQITPVCSEPSLSQPSHINSVSYNYIDKYKSSSKPTSTQPDLTSSQITSQKPLYVITFVLSIPPPKFQSKADAHGKKAITIPMEDSVFRSQKSPNDLDWEVRLEIISFSHLLQAEPASNIIWLN